MGWKPQLAKCATDVRIDLITTSVDMKHSSFAGVQLSVTDFTPPQTARMVHWRGTARLALLAGNAQVGGVAGLIPQARFYVANAFFTDPDGKPVSDILALLKALDWMSQSQLHIVLVDVALPRDELIEHAILAADQERSGHCRPSQRGRRCP